MTTDTKPLAERLRRYRFRAEESAGALPAKESVKVRPADWHCVCDGLTEAADALDAQAALLREAAQVLACLSAAADQFDRMPVRDPEQWVLWGMSSNHPGYPSKQITIGDARRARTLLSRIEAMK